MGNITLRSLVNGGPLEEHFDSLDIALDEAVDRIRTGHSCPLHISEDGNIVLISSQIYEEFHKRKSNGYY